MFIKDYSEKPFPSFARTLPVNNINIVKFNNFTYIIIKNNWIIIAKIIEDYFVWINEFIAIHLKENKYIFGNFEEIIFASSEEDLNLFLKDNPYEEWDYHDI